MATHATLLVGDHGVTMWREGREVECCLFEHGDKLDGAPKAYH